MRAVLERDFLSEASKPRAVVLRTVVAAVVAAAILLFLQFATKDSGIEPDRVGLYLFRTGAISLLVLLALLAPPLVVGSILAERQQETLPLVLASPVGGRSFALAKLLSRWALTQIVAFAALPALAFTVLFGGVAGSQILCLAVTSVALTLEFSAWALWISSASRRLATAVVLSFVLPLARWAAAGFLLAAMEHGIRSGGGTPGAEFSFAVVSGTTPFGAFLELLEPGEFLRGFAPLAAPTYPGTDFLVRQPAVAYLLFAIAAAGAAVVAAGKRLESEAEPRESILARTKRGRRWFRGLPGSGNPVAWKERRLLNTASSRPMFYGVLAVLASATFFGSGALAEDLPAVALVTGEITLVALVAVIQGAASLGHERDQGGWDLLRASRLTSGEILRGKLAGLSLGILFLGAIPACHLLIALAASTLALRTAVVAAALLVFFPMAWGIVGFRIGLAAPRVRVAVVRAVALFAAVLVGLPLIGFVAMAVESSLQDLALWLACGTQPLTLYFTLEAVQRPYQVEFWDRGSTRTICGLAWLAIWGIFALWSYVRLPAEVARRMDADRDGG